MKTSLGTNVNLLLGLQSQLKIMHWQTKEYAQHMAFGGIYDDLQDLIDTFVELAMGKYGRFELSNENNTIELVNLDDMDFAGFINTMRKALVQITKQLDSTDTDMLNVRDEMLGLINKLSYLLTLK